MPGRWEPAHYFSSLAISLFECTDSMVLPPRTSSKAFVVPSDASIHRSTSVRPRAREAEKTEICDFNKQSNSRQQSLDAPSSSLEQAFGLKSGSV